MAVKAISGSDKDQELIIDTLKHARRQEYTPQRPVSYTHLDVYKRQGSPMDLEERSSARISV